MIAELAIEVIYFFLGALLEPIEDRYGKAVAFLAATAIIVLTLAAAVLTLYLIFR